MDAERYADFVVNAPVGTITLVLLVNDYTAGQSKQMQQTFQQVVEEKIKQVLRLRLCCLCYTTYPDWFQDVLRQCNTIDEVEANDRVTACYRERIATVLALITKRGKKQVCIFPEVIESSGISNGDLQTNACAERPLPSRTNDKRTQMDSVGGVLSGTLGFEDKDYNSDPVDGVFHPEWGTGRGSVDSQSDPVDGRKTGSDSLRSQECNDSDSDSELLTWSSETYAHRNEASNDERMEQLSHKLWLWLEKLQDGTLKRHDVDDWPAWRQ